MAVDIDAVRQVLELDSVSPDTEEDKLLATGLYSLGVGDPTRDSVIEFIADKVALQQSPEFLFESNLWESDRRYIVVAAAEALVENNGQRPHPRDQWRYYPHKVQNVLSETYSTESLVGRSAISWLAGYFAQRSVHSARQTAHASSSDSNKRSEFDKVATDEDWAFAFDLLQSGRGDSDRTVADPHLRRHLREVMRSLDMRPWDEYPESLQYLVTKFGTEKPYEEVAAPRFDWWRAIDEAGVLDVFLAEVPDVYATAVKNLRIAGEKWTATLFDWQNGDLIRKCNNLNLIENELAFEAGCYALEKDMDPDDARIASSFLEAHSLPSSYVSTGLRRLVRTWAALRRFAHLHENSWQHESELDGIAHFVERLVFEDHRIWIDALPLALLHESDLEPLVGMITVAVHHLDPNAVVEALSSCLDSDCSKLRDRARGLLAKCTGGALKTGDQARDFISYGVRLLDGSPAFPNPLDVKSGIWIGSLAIEQLLAEAIDQASATFAARFRDSARVEEEQHTQRLLTDLEYSFKAAQLRVQALGTDSLPKGAISCEQRAVPKKEEDEYGCDVVILVNGSVRDSVAFAACELVQVKKPERKQGTNEYRDAWRISTGQLTDVTGYSQSATYWLIGTAGEVFAVPAKVLSAFASGQGKAEQNSFTINYSDIRSASIPLKQFIVQLVLGLWLGTTDERTLKFARGEEFGVVPQRVFEITVHAGGENG